MANYTRLSNGITLTECQLYTSLAASCGCLQGSIWRNDDTLVEHTGREWLAIFIADPPECSDGGSGGILATTADTTTTVSDVGITGTVVGIIGNAGATWTTGFTQVGTLVTLTDSSSWGVGDNLVILMT